jgi:hypothetical protein
LAFASSSRVQRQPDGHSGYTVGFRVTVLVMVVVTVVTIGFSSGTVVVVGFS